MEDGIDKVKKRGVYLRDKVLDVLTDASRNQKGVRAGAGRRQHVSAVCPTQTIAVSIPTVEGHWEAGELSCGDEFHDVLPVNDMRFHL